MANIIGGLRDTSVSNIDGSVSVNPEGLNQLYRIVSALGQACSSRPSPDAQDDVADVAESDPYAKPVSDSEMCSNSGSPQRVWSDRTRIRSKVSPPSGYKSQKHMKRNGANDSAPIDEVYTCSTGVPVFRLDAAVGTQT